MTRTTNTVDRSAALEMSSADFRSAGHDLVDQLADFLDSLEERPVTSAEGPSEIWKAVGDGPLPEDGIAAEELLPETAQLLFDHSLFNGHPRFWGYITSSAAPIGALGDLLTSTINANVAGWALAPMATAIEAQTVRWIAEFMGYPAECGGLLVSGGNTANFVGFIAARRAKTSETMRAAGIASVDQRLRVYASRETHTWIEKAADLFGLGTDAIRWIETDRQQRIDIDALRRQLDTDREASDAPFLLVGTAGTVSTGAIDPLPELAAIAREYDLWFHVDGAYGGLAAGLPDATRDLHGLTQADSVAVDPHKWLYAPLEAGCILVRDPEHLRDAFSYHPPYYHFDEEARAAINFVDYGPQNSRGFRALKVWLGLRQAGRRGYVRMISDDIQLAGELYQLIEAHPELEAMTNHLSITTFRYVPPDLAQPEVDPADYLNELNTAVLERLQAGGEAFVSNAVVDGKQLLRACIVNFRSTRDDIERLPELVVRVGREIDRANRPASEDSRRHRL